MATEETKTAEATATTTAQPTAQPTEGVDPNIVDPNSLSIGDLKNLATIIDIASSRGAFRANEMASIGIMYNKLQGFLNKVSSANSGAPTPVAGAAPATAQQTTVSMEGKK